MRMPRASRVHASASIIVARCAFSKCGSSLRHAFVLDVSAMAVFRDGSSAHVKTLRRWLRVSLKAASTAAQATHGRACGGRARVRVHIPIVTNKQVVFSCGQRGDEVRLHMKAGRAYLFDNHLGHAVRNDGSTPRVHLTVDLVGSRRFWELVRLSRRISSFRSSDSAAVASPWRVHPPLPDAPPPPLLV